MGGIPSERRGIYTVEIIFRADLGNPEKIAQPTKEYEDRFLSPIAAAERGYIDSVIEPCATRSRIARALALSRGKKLENPWKKHDNIPLSHLQTIFIDFDIKSTLRASFAPRSHHPRRR
jgi:hypothetical protein